MKMFALSARILGLPVMCGTLEAPTAAEARATWEKKFWAGPDDLRAALPTIDAMNRGHAEKMLACMEATRADAKAYGLVVTARPSRSAA